MGARMWAQRAGPWGLGLALLASIALHGGLLIGAGQVKPARSQENRAVTVLMRYGIGPTRTVGAKPSLPLKTGVNRQAKRQAAAPAQRAPASWVAPIEQPEQASLPNRAADEANAGRAPMPAVAETAAMLDRITQGVLRADKARQAEKVATQPWLSGSRPESARAVEHGMGPGGRTERVRSVLGDYCVKLPNPATAYRSANGVNLAGAGNCP
jgi:hypothetical protein